MQKVDKNETGFIDYSEFLAASLDENRILSTQNLQNTFKLFDRDGSGTITAAELNYVLGDEEMTNSPVWNEIIKEADTNGDGAIDINEFKLALLNKYE